MSFHVFPDTTDSVRVVRADPLIKEDGWFSPYDRQRPSSSSANSLASSTSSLGSLTAAGGNAMPPTPPPTPLLPATGGPPAAPASPPLASDGTLTGGALGGDMKVSPPLFAVHQPSPPPTPAP